MKLEAPETMGCADVLREVFLLAMDVAWWMSLAALLFLYVAPCFVEVWMVPWSAQTIRDPFLSYLGDGASLALGSGIYLSNHPGTPLHEVFAMSTKVTQYALGYADVHHAALTSVQMRAWIVAHPQSFVFINRFVAPLGFAGLLLSVAVCGRRLFYSRWLALWALAVIGALPLISRFSVVTGLESFYPAVLVVASAMCFFRELNSTRRLVIACFSIALLLSLKVINLPFALVFLCFSYQKDHATSLLLESRFQALCRILACVFLPIGLALFAAGILFLKQAKTTSRGCVKLELLIGACAAWLALYYFVPRLRTSCKKLPSVTLAILLIFGFFMVINIPMAWKAWIGFILNAGEQAFRMPTLRDYWGNIVGSPLRLWVFCFGLLAWVGQVAAAKRRLSPQRLKSGLFLPQMLPLYLLWVANYNYRDYNMIPFDIIGILFAFCCLGYLLELARDGMQEGGFSQPRHPLAVAVAASVLVPLCLGGLSLPSNLRAALARYGSDLSRLDGFHPESFTQGIGEGNHYTPEVAEHLNFANLYSKFHFPTGPSEIVIPAPASEPQE